MRIVEKLRAMGLASFSFANRARMASGRRMRMVESLGLALALESISSRVTVSREVQIICATSGLNYWSRKGYLVAHTGFEPVLPP